MQVDDSVRQVSTQIYPLPSQTKLISLVQAIMQLQSQQIEASRQLSSIRSQLTQRERDQKLNTLTLREIEQLPRDSTQVGCYRAVGRM